MTHSNSSNGTSHTILDAQTHVMTDDQLQSQQALNGTLTSSEPTDIDRVRDMLFGSHTRESERRFRTNERKIDELSLAVQRLSERLDHEVSAIQATLRQQQMQTMMRIEDVQRVAQERLQNQQREAGQRFEALSTTLTELTDLLDRTKLDQEQMGDLLLDMGTRLKRAAKAQMATLQNRANDEQHS